MEWLLILTLWSGEAVYDTWQTQAGCQAKIKYLIERDSPKMYGPSQYLNIYCEPLAPGEPIVKWWTLCSWRDGCWGPDTVNWSSIPPTKPGWYLHRYRVKLEDGMFDIGHPLKLDYMNGLLSIVGYGTKYRQVLPRYPVASLGGEWTQDALVLR